MDIKFRPVPFKWHSINVIESTHKVILSTFLSLQHEGGENEKFNGKRGAFKHSNYFKQFIRERRYIVV